MTGKEKIWEMESLTKFRQSEETIRKMARKFFPEREPESYEELTEGFFNAAYGIKLADGREVILKIAPSPDMRIMTYEKNIMFSEVNAMRLAGKDPRIPVPKVLGFDPEGMLCGSPGFFMEKVEGRSLNAARDGMTEEQIHAVYEETGRICAAVNQISCPCFGYPGQTGFQGKEWYPVFSRMLQAGVKDAQRGRVDLKISLDAMWKALERDRPVFEEVREPKLVHWDCWDGNIFVKDGRVTGIIDWERCIWGDPLLEVGFREYGQNPAFLRGYGISSFTQNQKKRILWYDVYLFLLMSLECEYRGYESSDMYEWAAGMLAGQLEKLLCSCLQQSQTASV